MEICVILRSVTDTPDPFLDLDSVRTMVRKWAIDCGNRVTKRRTDLAWDQARLAALVGTTEATISRVESGAVTPRDYLKLAIAGALSCEVIDLWPYPSRERVFAEAAA